MKKFTDTIDLQGAMLRLRNDFDAAIDARDAVLDAIDQLQTMYDEELSEGTVVESLTAIADILDRDIETKCNALRKLEKLHYGR